MSVICKTDGKVHRHQDEGYTLACETVLDGKPAIVTYHAFKGFTRAYWVTEATVSFCEGDMTQYPVHSSNHGNRVVKHAKTKKQALHGVGYLNEEGFVLRGNVALLSRSCS